MHYRFRGNPATNNAGRLFQHNQRRMAAGLQPLTLAEFQGLGKVPERTPPPSPKQPAKQPRKLF